MTNTITASASATINANSTKVFEALSDPKLHADFQAAPFYDFVVEKDIKGEGAIVDYKIDFASGTINFRMLVTTPEIDRKIVWTDQNKTGLITTFDLEPDGEKTKLTITSEWVGQEGVVGTLEKVISPIRMRGVYKKELGRINEYVSQN